MGVISRSAVLGAPAGRNKNYHEQVFKRALNLSKTINFLRYNFIYVNLHRILSCI